MVVKRVLPLDFRMIAEILWDSYQDRLTLGQVLPLVDKKSYFFHNLIMDTNVNALDVLTNEVNGWLDGYLKGYKPKRVSSNTVIKDPVWGMTALTPLEISILDSPLLQRLRRIHQTGLVFLTYPAALHTRFDHSVGMLHCATLIVDSINRKYKSVGQSCPFSDAIEQTIRLACLLHDIGHSALSHLTEEFFSNYIIIEKAKNELEKEKGVRPKNHELLSAIIVRTERFISILDETFSINRPPYLSSARQIANHISDMIIGLPIDGNYENSYITEIINGPYDADRLDYIFRDSYFTGISLGTDAEKFIAGLSLEKIPDKRRNIDRRSMVLDINAASSYDQLILSKVSLCSTVYNHQKVLATNQVVQNILKILRDNPDKSINGVNIRNPIDFLSLTDWDFLIGNTDSDDIKKLQENIERRNLPVRYVRMSRLSIEGGKEHKISPDASSYFTTPEKLEELRIFICNNLGVKTSGPNTLGIALPRRMELKELCDAYCKEYGGSLEPFNNLSPANHFTNYLVYKWVGYIFGPYELLTEGNYTKICSILEDRLHIKLNQNAKPKKLQ